MPKLKTHRGYKKRIKKVTKNGKIIHDYCGKSHFKAKRSSSRKRKLAISRSIDTVDKSRIMRVIPYL